MMGRMHYTIYTLDNELTSKDAQKNGIFSHGLKTHSQLWVWLIGMANTKGENTKTLYSSQGHCCSIPDQAEPVLCRFSPVIVR